MFELFHNDQDCPGHWREHFEEESAVWECTRCGAGYSDSPSVRKAAEDENLLGALLLSLTLAGQELL
ncbi:MAG: hypothetical protein M3P24_03310 [Gemmatimonadota bacterium]|nr:hypothetical protein [Gemmatimonadota bacterium]